jgi:arsenate reductase
VPAPDPDPPERDASPDDRPLRVLFLCTHNSARSQLAEGLTRLLAGDRVAVASAGSAPTAVHPLALALLREWGLDPTAYSSKALERFAGTPFDYIITLCDRVREECPVFPDDPLRLHWSLPDPALAGDEAAQWAAFNAVGSALRTRLGYLLAQPHPATGRRLLLPPTIGGGSAA